MRVQQPGDDEARQARGPVLLGRSPSSSKVALVTEEEAAKRYKLMSKVLDERQSRIWNGAEALAALFDPATRGDPGSPLRWTCKSIRALAAELQAQGFTVSQHKVGELLGEMGYSLRNR